MAIRAAFIGVGGISPVHLDYLKTRDDVQLVGLMDLDAKTLATRQGTYGGATYSDTAAMLDAEKPDAVWLCTPPLVRRAPLLACAERGIPVFCEKPVERTVAAARAISAELDRLGAHVQVGYVFRATPLVQRLRALLATDRVHTVQSYYGSNMGLTRSFAPWFYEKEKSGGGLVDQATHNFDLLRYLFGEVVQVQGVGGNPVTPKTPGYTVEDTLATSFRFADGVLGTHVHSWVARGWSNEIVLQGEKREYRVNPGSKLVVKEGTEVHEYVESGSIYVHQNKMFLDCVTSGDWSTCLSTYADAVKTLEWTLGSDDAITSGKPVTL